MTMAPKSLASIEFFLPSGKAYNLWNIPDPALRSVWWIDIQASFHQFGICFVEILLMYLEWGDRRGRKATDDYNFQGIAFLRCWTVCNRVIGQTTWRSDQCRPSHCALPSLGYKSGRKPESILAICPIKHPAGNYAVDKSLRRILYECLLELLQRWDCKVSASAWSALLCYQWDRI